MKEAGVDRSSMVALLRDASMAPGDNSNVRKTFHRQNFPEHWTA